MRLSMAWSFAILRISCIRLSEQSVLAFHFVLDVLSLPVLVLNRHYVPIQLTTVKRALVMLYGCCADALDEAGELFDFETWRALPVRETDDVIPIINGALRAPRIVHLNQYDRTPRVAVRLSRRNLMIRDAYECQYCGVRPGQRAELNIDHIVPKSRGGEDTWENLVTSCKPCNLRKGRKTPEEANMRLSRKPFRPKWSSLAQTLLGHDRKFKEWEPFLKAA
jgi:5-methylcytosine-specific restriction endonuclease McrA